MSSIRVDPTLGAIGNVRSFCSSLLAGHLWLSASGSSIYNFRRCVSRANVRRLRDNVPSPGAIVAGLMLDAGARTRVRRFDADNSKHPTNRPQRAT